jgi:hypothetical protein
LNLPDKIYLVFIGICTNAFFGPCLIVPVVPEIIECVTDEQRIIITKECELEDGWTDPDQLFEEVERRLSTLADKLVDKASALQNMAYAMGAGIGPLMGGKLTDLYGFRSTADIISAITLAYAVVNFGIVFMPGMLCKTKKRALLKSLPTSEVQEVEKE